MKRPRELEYGSCDRLEGIYLVSDQSDVVSPCRACVLVGVGNEETHRHRWLDRRRVSFTVDRSSIPATPTSRTVMFDPS